MNLVIEKLSEHKESLENIILETKKVMNVLEHNEYEKVIDDILDNIESPFMFVIIGEVKAGKSSFINAVLNDTTICKVDASICTDTVQQLVYSDFPYDEKIKNNLIRRGVNSEILKDISIVDTPGTDSIVEEHEIITKEFAPNSDLVIFVFPTTNPHHASAWKMLEYMKKEWDKKIIFISQQADRCSKEEIEINTTKIRQYAIERGISNPKIFVTSAKLEFEGYEKVSGIPEVRSYIEDTVTGGKHLKLKYLEKSNTVKKILKKLEESIVAREKQIMADYKLREDIKLKLSSGELRAKNELDSIVKRLNTKYKRITSSYSDEFRDLLSTKNLLKQAVPMVDKKRIDKTSTTRFLEKMKYELKDELEKESRENAEHLISGVKKVFSSIVEELDATIISSDKTFKTFDSFNHKREEILHDLKLKLEELISEENFLGTLATGTPHMEGLVTGGGTMAAVGAFLALSTQVAWLDITGGILTTAGVFGAGGIMMVKRKHVISAFDEKIEKSAVTFDKEIREQFYPKIEMIYEEIDRLFESMDSTLRTERESLEKSRELVSQIKKEIFQLDGKLK